MATIVLPVLFRAEKEAGEYKDHVTAVFPTLPGTGPYDFTVYDQIGQHSTGSKEWYRRTRPATPREYAAVLRELRAIYESADASARIKVVSRITADMDRERMAAARIRPEV